MDNLFNSLWQLICNRTSEMQLKEVAIVSVLLYMQDNNKASVFSKTN